MNNATNTDTKTVSIDLGPKGLFAFATPYDRDMLHKMRAAVDGAEGRRRWNKREKVWMLDYTGAHAALGVYKSAGWAVDLCDDAAAELGLASKVGAETPPEDMTTDEIYAELAEAPAEPAPAPVTAASSMDAIAALATPDGAYGVWVTELKGFVPARFAEKAHAEAWIGKVGLDGFADGLPKALALPRD